MMKRAVAAFSVVVLWVALSATATAATGDRVVYEWEGYTIGYFGRPFEKKAGLKGGDFEGERDYSRFVVGRGAQIKFRGTSP